MASSISLDGRAAEHAGRRDAVWPLYAVLFASLSIVVGLIWDISWHRTIGRDSFWSAPHVLEQLAALVAGVSCGWVVLRTTFAGSAAEHGRTVKFWGFRGPLGGWVCIWGSLVMIASAPFDNWWHNSYGLDVTLISPPHLVLAFGMIAIQVGAMMMALAFQNRADAREARRLQLLYICSAAILLTMHATVLMEEAAFPHLMHAARFYIITALFFPLMIVGLTLPSRLPWPATTAAAIYMALDLLLMWGLQLMPAQARLAPIYNPVTHMVPHPFPLLLVVPAVAIDLILARVRGNPWKIALFVGFAWVALLASVQWLFAEFLLSPAARNFVFGADQWDYRVQLGTWRYEWWELDVDASGAWSPLRFFGGLGIAALIATCSARIGIGLGRNMAGVRR